MSRTVLIIVHDYPPIRSAGAERLLKFAQYLPQFGYRPLILTTGRYGGLLDDVERQIYRADDLIHNIFGFWRRHTALTVPQEEQYRVATIANRSLLGCVRDAIMIPDTKLGWLLPAVRLGLRVIAAQQPSIILSSSPPETTHLVAGRLSRATGVPWVADLRDGWAQQSPNPALREQPLRQTLELALERRMMTQASGVTTTTPALTADLAQRYPPAQRSPRQRSQRERSQRERRIVTITNGFDSTDFANLARRRPVDGTFRLVYTGAFSLSSPDRSAEPLFSGLAALTRVDPATRLRVQIIGTLTDKEQGLASQYGLDSIVSLVPPVRRDEVYQYQADADALLLVQGAATRALMPSKLFDYIGAGKPILALTDGNVAEDIIREYHLGEIAPSDDPTAVAAALQQLMAAQTTAAPHAGFAAAQARFERRALTGELAAFFDEILNTDELR